MGARIAVPLGVLLPCLAVSLAASGAVATGVAMASGASGYLARQADQDVLACAESLQGRSLVVVPGSVPPGALPTPSLPGGPVLRTGGLPAPPYPPGPPDPPDPPSPAGACGIELLSTGGQVLVRPADGGPVIPSGRSWLAAHLARPVTVPGAGTGGRWRVVVMAVRYQARRIPYVYGPDDMQYVISGPTGHGQAGLAAVMAGLAGASRITGRVAAGYAVAAGVVLVLLAVAALAAVRGISRAAEAAARQSARQMSRRLGEVSQELRTPVSVVHGFAQYCRHRGTPPPAGLDQMMRRVAGEAARMDTLLQELDEVAGLPEATRRRCSHGRDDQRLHEDSRRGGAEGLTARPAGPAGHRPMYQRGRVLLCTGGGSQRPARAGAASEGIRPAGKEKVHDRDAFRRGWGNRGRAGEQPGTLAR